MKLLIVDNDCDMVEMLTSWLKTPGYEVHRTYSGERAKVEWEEQKPDHVILDPASKDVDALDRKNVISKTFLADTNLTYQHSAL